MDTVSSAFIAGKRILPFETKKGGLSASALAALIEGFLRKDVEFREPRIVFQSDSLMVSLLPELMSSCELG